MDAIDAGVTVDAVDAVDAVHAVDAVDAVYSVNLLCKFSQEISGNLLSEFTL